MRPTTLLAAAVLLAATAGVPRFALAIEGASPAPPQTSSQPSGSTSSSSTKKSKKKDKSSSLEDFYNGWHKAYALVYDKQDYEGGIAVLRSMGFDDNADVATLIGYASRKLGRYDDAKLWYDRALAADPNHALTWSYYGMWQAEQGNVLKAKDDLEKVRSICGTECREFTALKQAIDGTVTY
ncbi:MAG: tetratricopeptide repeat protein [Xanthobacteraceae bacterium]